MFQRIPPRVSPSTIWKEHSFSSSNQTTQTATHFTPLWNIPFSFVFLFDVFVQTFFPPKVVLKMLKSESGALGLYFISHPTFCFHPSSSFFFLFSSLPPCFSPIQTHPNLNSRHMDWKRDSLSSVGENRSVGADSTGGSHCNLSVDHLPPQYLFLPSPR